jgi:hypothetical protein
VAGQVCGKEAERGRHLQSGWALGCACRNLYGDYLILDAVLASGGTVVALTDEEIFASLKDWASKEGILMSPEGTAATAELMAIWVP